MLAMAERKDIYVFGDSISKGIALDEQKERYGILKDNFIALLQNSGNYVISNFSVFGATIRKGMQIFGRQAKKMQQNSLVLLEFGNNDCDMPWADIAAEPDIQYSPQVPLETFKQQYEVLIKEVRAKGSTPVLFTLTPLYAEWFFETVTKDLDKEAVLRHIKGDIQMIYRWQEYYSMAVWQLALEHGCEVIDVRSEFLKQYAYQDFLCRDGMHPNAAGHNLIEKVVAAKLAEWTQ